MIKTEIKQAMLEDLELKSSSIVDCILELEEQGYTPNSAKQVKLSWLGILLEAVKQDSFYTTTQLNNINVIYNKVMNL